LLLLWIYNRLFCCPTKRKYWI